MHIGELRESRFLTKDDCGKGILVTIAGVDRDAIESEDGTKDVYVLKFAEAIKPMVLKPTNAQLIAHALGADDTDDWTGKQIVLFNDQTVMMKGKIVGGIRARGSRKPQPVAAKPAPEPVDQPEMVEDEGEDDLPF